MRRRWTAMAALLAALSAAASRAAPAAAAYEDLTDDFDRFARDTASLPDAERAARFRATFVGRAGGFYDRRDRDAARYDAQIVGVLKAWPARREATLAVARDFRAAFARGIAKFRRAFPDFHADVPVYLVHAMGEMDGGTRDYGRGTLLFFGADVIARIHGQRSVGPLFDHEFFHVYHGQRFPGCAAVWCALWEEGLAVYVTAQLNPDADDGALLLTSPQPLRPAIAPRLREAMCGLRPIMGSTRPEDIGPLFQGRPVAGTSFPPRYGYLLGYVLVQQLGRDRSPAELARLTPAEVRPLLDRAIAAYGPCRARAWPRR